MLDRLFVCVFAGIAVSTVIACAVLIAEINTVVTPAAVQSLMN